jgi:hypothetical protein
MAKLRLDRRDAGTVGDQQARAGVAKIVKARLRLGKF